MDDNGPVRIPLNDEQRRVCDEVRTLLNAIMSQIRQHEQVNQVMFKDMVEKAHSLHESLAAAGYPPKHHKYMIENRGLQPHEFGFYDHVHPVEDLLKFIDDIHANDDPEDQTIGDEFTVSIFSRRWGHDDNYRFTRTQTGWIIERMQNYKTGKDGTVGGQKNSGLYALLDHDSINYPEELPGYLEWLWERAAEDGLSHEVVQMALKQLGDWITICERNSPTGIFRGYK